MKDSTVETAEEGKNGGQLHVVDSNVFIHGAGRKLPFKDMATVPGVTEELESFRSQRRFEAEDVDIREPGEKSVREVEDMAGEELEEVSETDKRLLALAMETDSVLVTDDYHMQNLAEKAGVRYQEFMKEGIEEQKDWEKVCSNCGRKLEQEKCPVCGSRARKTESG
ncbi:MAG: DNA-binding protein [Candidatus Nanohaloarchaea archaeon]|nr:DNA-binding protein [Candidatus Nanohaloarchaea archaeon]